MTSPQTRPFASVIVPVYNDPARLAACLKALENQTYSRDLYEVIVVDNGSDESLDGLGGQFPRVRFASESRPGSYAARNLGISLSRGEVLAFTDADCTPTREWLEEAVKCLSGSSRCGLLAGKIELAFRDPARLNAVELYEKLRNFRQDEAVSKRRYGAGANLFTFRSVLDHVGLFDAEVKSGGDIEWGQRVAAAGYELMYGERCIVSHAARSTLPELYKRQARLIGGFVDWKRRKAVYYAGLGKGFWIDALPPVRASIGVLRNPEIRHLSQKFKVINVLFYVQAVQVMERIRLAFGGTSRR